LIAPHTYNSTPRHTAPAKRLENRASKRPRGRLVYWVLILLSYVRSCVQGIPRGLIVHIFDIAVLWVQVDLAREGWLDSGTGELQDRGVQSQMACLYLGFRHGSGRSQHEASWLAKPMCPGLLWPEKTTWWALPGDYIGAYR
jgi:hypothetical protein